MDENFYDLYAVCNHSGGMSGGHYTAYCKNPVNGTWYLFDDMRVERISENQIVTKAAYLLFYARRNVGSSSGSESSASSDHWVWRMPKFSFESVYSSRDELSGKEERRNGKRTIALYFFLDAFVSEEDLKLLDDLNPRVAQVWESSGLGMTSQKQSSIVFDFVNGSLLFSGYLRLC